MERQQALTTPPEIQEPEMPNLAMDIASRHLRDASSGQFASPETWKQYETNKAAYDSQEATKAETARKETEKTALYEKLSALPEGTEDEKHSVSAIADKAGLSWKEAYEMGNGGFGELVKESRAWKAEQTPKEPDLTPAEKRQSEYAGLLKAHDKEVLAAATRVAEAKEAEKAPEQLPTPAIELPVVTPEPSKELVPVASTEVARIPSKELVPATSSESDNLPVLWKAAGELAPVETGEPVDQGGWLRRGFDRAKNAILLAPVNIPHRVTEWARRHFTEEDENGERQTRWGKAAIAAGGLAVAMGGVYIAAKGFGHGSEAVAATPRPGSGSGHGGEVVAQSLGWTDTINAGDGLTNSIMDYAQQHGVKIEPQRAFDIFNELKAGGLVDPSHISGSAPMDVMGNIGYVSPGQTTWSAETVARMNELLGLQ